MSQVIDQVVLSDAAPENTATMLGIAQTRYGTNPEEVLRLTTVARPSIGEGEVVVRVSAASVDRGTWHLMSGLQYLIRLGSGLRRPKALNPGRSFAGTVVAVGNDVTEFKVDDRVYGTGSGAFSQFVGAQTKRIAVMPTNLSFDQAAAVPVSGLSALQALRDKAEAKSGDKVLVIGASGGVGTFCVQIAKSYGADVTGVCSSAKVDLVRSLGADAVIDYTVESFLDGDQRYDVIIDTGGNSRLSDLRRVLAPRGRLVTVGGESDARWIWPTAGRQVRSLLLSPFTRQKLRSLIASENGKDLSELREIIESGDVVPAIAKVFPLAESAAAIRYLQDGHARGKVVIDVDDERQRETGY